MRMFVRLSAVAWLIGTLCAAQPAWAAQAKPQAKSASTTNKAKLGTTQLKGGEPKFGETWTLGKSNPWNITLNSAEYSVHQFQVGDRTCWPKADEKFLILHYTIHNPQPREAMMRFDTLRFTVVDFADNNWQGKGWIVDEKDGTQVNMRLKPAQKMQVRTAIPVPASGVMPKLMIEGSDRLVLRYDIRKIAKGLSAPFADPNEATGTTALQEVPAQPGVYYPMGQWNVKFDSAELVTDEVTDAKPPKGAQWLAVTLTGRNITKQKELLRFDSFGVQLIDQDGVQIKRHSPMYVASRWARLETRVEPGQEVTFRYLFPVENDQNLKSFTMQRGHDDRSYTFDASAWK